MLPRSFASIHLDAVLSLISELCSLGAIESFIPSALKTEGNQ
jgi:hypothetical protein